MKSASDEEKRFYRGMPYPYAQSMGIHMNGERMPNPWERVWSDPQRMQHPEQELVRETVVEEAAAAQETAEKLEKITLEIKTKGGESGKLFGSITSKDIADALEKQEKIKVDKKKIEMSSPIKQAGQSTVTIKLFSEVSAELKVNVTV